MTVIRPGSESPRYVPCSVLIVQWCCRGAWDQKGKVQHSQLESQGWADKGGSTYEKNQREESKVDGKNAIRGQPAFRLNAIKDGGGR